MITRRPAEKTLAFLLVAVAALIAVIHIWYPITVSSPDPSERTAASLTMLFFVASTPYGYRWARGAVGFSYVLFAGINLLIVLAYFSTLSFNQLAQFIITTFVLGATGVLFLKWKGVRVFEEESRKQKLINP